MVQLWGECVLRQDLHGTSLEGTVSEETIVGKTCFDDAFCQEEDINTLCFRSNELVEGLCKCRHEIFIRNIVFMIIWQAGDAVEQSCLGMSGLSLDKICQTQDTE